MTRQFLPPFAELLDRVTVNQIKEVLLPKQYDAVAAENDAIGHDLDLLIKERKLPLTADVMRMLIALAQMNLHIWYNKDQMQEKPDQYNELLKLAHQLNGLRNQLKNNLMEALGDKEKGAKRSNYNTDGLEGWKISILNKGSK